MGLMDKVKAQASQVAQKTQDTAQAGKAKYDRAQASRHADAMLQQLGTAMYAERTGRGTADSQAKIDKLVNDISGYERENGLNLTDQPQPTVPQPGSPPDRAGPLSTVSWPWCRTFSIDNSCLSSIENSKVTWYWTAVTARPLP